MFNTNNNNTFKKQRTILVTTKLSTSFICPKSQHFLLKQKKTTIKIKKTYEQ